jgi:hypothetical protein
MKKKNNNLLKIQKESSKWARWIALYEAVNYCAQMAEQKNIPFHKVNLKPLEIMRYITSTEDIICKKILKEIYNIDVFFDDNDDTHSVTFNDIEKY